MTAACLVPFANGPGAVRAIRRREGLAATASAASTETASVIFAGLDPRSDHGLGQLFDKQRGAYGPLMSSGSGLPVGTSAAASADG